METGSSIKGEEEMNTLEWLYNISVHSPHLPPANKTGAVGFPLVLDVVGAFDYPERGLPNIGMSYPRGEEDKLVC